MKHITAISIFFLGICMIISSWILSRNESITDSTPAAAAVPANEGTMPELLNREQAMDYLGVTSDQLSKLTVYLNGYEDDYRLPYIKISSDILYPKSGLNQWLKAIRFVNID